MTSCHLVSNLLLSLFHTNLSLLSIEPCIKCQQGKVEIRRIFNLSPSLYFYCTIILYDWPEFGEIQNACQNGYQEKRQDISCFQFGCNKGGEEQILNKTSIRAETRILQKGVEQMLINISYPHKNHLKTASSPASKFNRFLAHPVGYLYKSPIVYITMQ